MMTPMSAPGRTRPTTPISSGKTAHWIFAVWTCLLLLCAAPRLDSQSCTGLCLQQVTCPNAGVSTTISGTVYAPNGVDPLPGVLVYIPNAPVQPFPAGVQCLQAGQPASGSPLVSTTTGVDGKFTLKNVPHGSNIPLVIQAGKWRRQVVISNVASCANTLAPATLTRFPRTKAEGDIPLIGIVTGSVDALECVMRKVGVADSEFSNPATQGGNGRIQVYFGGTDGGAVVDTSTPNESTLYANQASLNQYDLMMYACQGERASPALPASTLAALTNYANAGGRLFMTHYNYDKLFTNSGFPNIAAWSPDQSVPADQTAFVDTTFPKGLALAQWLQVVNASTTLGQIPVSTLRKDQNAVIAPTQSYLSIHSPAESIQFTFNTPVGAPTAQQCGRVLFNEYHVENVNNSQRVNFPSECAAGAMTPQEKLLEYSIFDLSTFVSPDIPPTASVSFTNSATPVTQGDAADSVVVNITNTSTSTPANPSLTATLALPVGLTATALGPQLATSGWNCNLGTLTCTRTTGLDAEATDALVLTFSVASDAPAAETITATVAGGGLAANVSNTDSFAVLVVPTIIWASPTPILYGTALSNVQLNATASYNSNPVAGTFTYNPSAGTVPSPGIQTLSVTFTPADPTTYTSASATTTLQVNQATPSITWTTPAPITYGTALSATQLNATASFNGNPVPGTYSYSPAAGTVLQAGTQTLQVTFNPTDTSTYTAATTSVSLQVNQATPSITWATPTPITYGTALSATQLNATSPVTGTFTYSPAAGTVSNAGSQTLQVSFTPSDTVDYTSATASVRLQVNQAAPSITWATPAAITYGTALSGTQLNATSPVAGTFTYLPPSGTVLAAGNRTLQVNFTPTDTANYSSATASVSLAVNQATPSITWATPAPITYGTALSAAQLNATASVPGSFAYLPATGTVLGAANQLLQVNFTPTDTTDYTPATATVTLQVVQATPSITWATPAAITYGTALGAAQLNATSPVAGSFNYNPPSGTVLSAGSHTLSATFTPTDLTDYAPATATVTLQVNQATPTITWATPAAITYGTALSATQLNATASTPGSFSYSPAAGAVLQAGSRTLTVTFTPTDTSDTTATATVTLQVNQATPTITWATPAAITYGTALSATQLNASASVAGSFTYSPAAGTVLGAGSPTLNTTFTPADATDYKNATASVLLQVNPATPVLTFTVPNHTLGDAPFAVSASSPSTGAITYSVVSGPATVSGSTVTLTGAATVVLKASQAAAGNYTAGTAQATFTVAAPATTVTLYVAVTTLVYPLPPAFDVRIMVKNNIPPTGTVTLYDGTTAVGTYPVLPILFGNALGLVLPPLNVGQHSLKAVYSGDKNYAPGTSQIVIVTVKPGPVNLDLTCSSTSLKLGKSTTCTVVATEGALPVNGTVSYTLTGSPSGVATLSNGRTTFTVTPPLGTDVLTVTFAAQGNYQAASDATTIKVTK